MVWSGIRKAGKAAPVIERAQAAAHRTIDRVAETAQPAAQWAAESGHRLAARSNALADSCTGYVRDRPFTALAGALAIGYFAGRLMR